MKFDWQPLTKMRIRISIFIVIGCTWLSLPPDIDAKSVDANQIVNKLVSENSLSSLKTAGSPGPSERSIRIRPDQGFNGVTNYQPSGWRITETVGGQTERPFKSAEEKVKVYTYPYGVGPVLINGCTENRYSSKSPCSAIKLPGEGKLTCPNLMEATSYIGVGFDGRGYYKIKSRKASLVQRSCANTASFMGKDVPDTMNVYGIFETVTETKTFQSADEYMSFIRNKAGVANQKNMFASEASQYSKSSQFGAHFAAVRSVPGAIFGGKFGGPQGAAMEPMEAGAALGNTISGGSDSGTSQADGSRMQQGSSNTFIATMYISIILYEITLDNVKPQDLNLAVLKDYMNLPASYYSIGADVKYQHFLVRWGSHYIRAAKFGGQLKITKTARANKVSSVDEFASIAETEFQSMFSILQSKSSQESSDWGVLAVGSNTANPEESSSRKWSRGNNQKMDQDIRASQSFRQSGFTHTEVEAQGGTPEIAEALLDFYTPAFRQLYHDWIASIKDYTKPFEFQLNSIADLFDMDMDDLFPTGDAASASFGCLSGSGTAANILTDPVSKRRYYMSELADSGNNRTTQVRVYCKYDNVDEFSRDLERRQNSLQKAIAVCMAEGPIPTSAYELKAGQQGCEVNAVAQFDFLPSGMEPLATSQLRQVPFLISFDLPVGIPYVTEAEAKYKMVFRNDRWFATEPHGHLARLYDGCQLEESSTPEKVCFRNLILEYEDKTGLFRVSKSEFDKSRANIGDLPYWLRGMTVARASRMEQTDTQSSSHTSESSSVPCNVRWLNSHRLDPGNEVNCLHFTAATEGKLFVIFASVPKDRTTWYYLEISDDGVGYYHALKQEHRETAKGIGGLGDANLYQTYFVCVVQGNDTAFMQYGRADPDDTVETVYSSYTFKPDSQYSRLSFYSFGAASKDVSLMNIRLVRAMPKQIKCMNDKYILKDGHCVLDCHKECRGCNRVRDNTACFSCVNLKLVTIEAKRNVSTCVAECPPGYELVSKNTSQTCVRCPAGRYKMNYGNSRCTMCSKGTFTSVTASTNCNQCSPGSYSDQEGSDECKPCPVGTFTKTNGSAQCEACPPATFAAHAGQIECSLCRKGTFGNTTGQAACQPCSAGYFADSEGQKVCKKCPIGGNSTMGSSSCENNCNKGEFSPNLQTACRKCPPGSMAESAGSTKCELCQGGSYQPKSGQSECIQAPKGSYAPGPNATAYIECPAGSANEWAGQSDSSKCIPCYRGFASKSGASQCEMCPALYHAPTAGSAECLPCPVGQCSLPGSFFCADCTLRKIKVDRCSMWTMGNGAKNYDSSLSLATTCEVAIDGELNQDTEYCARTVTARSYPPAGSAVHSWQAVLYKLAVIEMVQIYNPKHCCKNSLTNATIMLQRNDEAEILCAKIETTFLEEAFFCQNTKQIVNKVSIYSYRLDPLVLCEVHLFGYDVAKEHFPK